MRLSSEQRFWRFVRKTKTCWLWIGYKRKSKKGLREYGRFRVDGKLVTAHKWIYEKKFGEVPRGKELHHKCNVGLCVRWSHLFPKTPKQHYAEEPRGFGPINRAKKCCPSGHRYTPKNTYIYKIGRKRLRHCRACHRIKSRERMRVLRRTRF